MVEGQHACGAIGNNDRLLMACHGGAYKSLGTCREPCQEVGALDSLLCDGMRHAEKGTSCEGDTPWACEAGGGSVLRCLNGKWIAEQLCAGDTESCVSNEDGKFKTDDNRTPTLRCANY